MIIILVDVSMAIHFITFDSCCSTLERPGLQARIITALLDAVIDRKVMLSPMRIMLPSLSLSFSGDWVIALPGSDIFQPMGCFSRALRRFVAAY